MDGRTGSKGVKEKTQTRAEEKRDRLQNCTNRELVVNAVHVEAGSVRDSHRGGRKNQPRQPEPLRYRQLRSSAPPVQHMGDRGALSRVLLPLTTADVRLETLALLNRSLVPE